MSTPTYGTNTIILCSCFYVETLSQRKVLTQDKSKLPGVELGKGNCKPESEEFMWIMGLGKEVPVFEPPTKSEIGSFRGNFKEATIALRSMMGVNALGELQWPRHPSTDQKRDGWAVLRPRRQPQSVASSQSTLAEGPASFARPTCLVVSHFVAFAISFAKGWPSPP